MKVSFYTLGCKVNTYDTQIIVESFKEKGYTIGKFDEINDIYVINTCAVTNESERKSKQIVRRSKRINPNGITVLTGCFSEVNEEGAKSISEADIICGTHKRHLIVEYVNEFIKNKKRSIHMEKNTSFDESLVVNYEDKTRAVVKIQDGCNMYCSYCIIPYARGNSKSGSIPGILHQIKDIEKLGYKEIVLTGIHIASFRGDNGQTLIDLIELIDKTTNINRLRLGSLEPNILSEEFLQKLKEVKSFCPHFHVSLQSGCDKILKLMNRKYKTNEYLKIVENIRKYFKGASITTDIIVGFPNEDDIDFAETLDFTKKVSFSHIHIFPYSKKEGTKAFDLKGHLNKETKSIRAKKLKTASLIEEKNFLNSLINESDEVLIEKNINGNIYEGYSKNYVKTYIESEIDITNEIIKVKFETLYKDGIKGGIINEN